jgi:hypothetical protein
MCRLIFLGPSLDLETARGILSDAIYLPPLRQADLLSAMDRYRPSAIGVIDGYFMQDLSVWHKEILLALQRGITVYGASSMGALRAAEMAPYGMRGIGRVYEGFANGSLTDDDEVALAHSPAELGYARLSEPMVNVRATLAAALEREVIPASAHDIATQAAKAIYFTERNAPRLAAAWRGAGLPDELVNALEEFFRFHYVDVKRRDAIALLQTMAASALERPSPRQDLEAPHSFSFDTLYHRDRRMSSGEMEIEMARIFRYAAIHVPDFESLRFQALNRKLTLLFAANLGFIAGAEEIGEESRRFRAGQGIADQESFLTWLRDNDLTEEEFLTLLGEKATCRRVHQWWLAVAGGPAQRAKVMLDELKLSGKYQSVAQAAAEMAERTSEVPYPDMQAWTKTEVAALVREHAAETGFRLDVPIRRWADETGYLAFEDLLTDLYLSKANREFLNGRIAAEKEVA